jgi:transcriptional regulator GlxA family with amidase domain
MSACGADGAGRAAGLESHSAHGVPATDSSSRASPSARSRSSSPVVLREARAGGARIASICTGAFALAAAGLLDRRPATTHWMALDDLRARYPLVDVQPSQVYVDDGDVLTSAGVLAGVDLCLHLVRSDRGAATANSRARALVATPRRTGNQSAYSARLTPPVDGDTIGGLCGELLDRLDEQISIDEMARAVHMSRRTFIRRFTEATGTPPHTWLTRARLDAARELLERTDDPVELIGRRAGLGSAAAFRSTFHRYLGMSPTEYRRGFHTADSPRR